MGVLASVCALVAHSWFKSLETRLPGETARGEASGFQLAPVPANGSHHRCVTHGKGLDLHSGSKAREQLDNK